MSAEFDPAKSALNLRKHGVSLAEGDGVLNDPLAITIEELSAVGEQRFVTIGMNTFASLMVVVWTERGENIRLISVRRAEGKERRDMKKEYDFSKGKRGAVVPTTGKTRVTMYLDDEIVRRFKDQSERTGKGYQTLINDALKLHLGVTESPLTPELLRKIVREELAAKR